MANNTNIYAERKRASTAARGQETSDTEARDWYPVVVLNLKFWVGIIIHMGIRKMPVVEDMMDFT
jgi:hypothetical protein